jgi:Holliday junction resolvase RusA-like endonuclease
MQTIYTEPVPKPRMTQRDKWLKRDCVMRYRLYCDILRMNVVLPAAISGRITVDFYLPIPASFSAKKRRELAGKPHKRKPDLDNMVKAVIDGLYEADSHIHDIRARKLYDDGQGARVELEVE